MSRRDRHVIRAGSRQRGGYLLLLAAVLIGGVAMTLTLIARHTLASVQTNIRHALDIRAAQLAADGLAWIAGHPEQAASLKPGETIVLDAAATAFPAANGQLVVVCDSEGDLLVRARIQTGDRVALFEVRASLPLEEAAP